MRVGLMVGSDKERPRAARLAGLLEDGQAAEADGFASFWIPQVPGYLDAMTAVALLGHVTDRIEIGTAVVPLQTRHPLILAQQALTTQVACAGRFALGVGPSHHWIISDQLGLPYDKPAHLVRDYLEVLDAAFAGPGAVAVDNDSFSVRSPIDVTDAFAMPVLIAALGPTMLRIAGERTAGTILWMADERAIGDYVVPRITEAARVCRTIRNPCRGRRSGRTLLRERGRHRPRLRQRSAWARRLLPELCPAARTRRRRRRRRHDGRGRRVDSAGAPAPVSRRGCHRSRRSGGSARR